MKPSSSSSIWEEFVIWIGGSKVEIFYVIKTKYFKWASPGLFFLYFCLFNAVDSKMFNLIVIADDWIRTTILWTRKRRSTNWATTTAQLKQNIQISKGQKNLFIILSFHPKPSIIIFVQLNSTHPFLFWIRLKCAIFTKKTVKFYVTIDSFLTNTTSAQITVFLKHESLTRKHSSGGCVAVLFDWFRFSSLATY